MDELFQHGRKNKVAIGGIQLSNAISCSAKEYMRYKKGSVNMTDALSQYGSGIHLTVNGRKVLANEIVRESLIGWIRGLYRESLMPEN